MLDAEKGEQAELDHQRDRDRRRLPEVQRARQADLEHEEDEQGEGGEAEETGGRLQMPPASLPLPALPLQKN